MKSLEIVKDEIQLDKNEHYGQKSISPSKLNWSNQKLLFGQKINSSDSKDSNDNIKKYISNNSLIRPSL